MCIWSISLIFWNFRIVFVLMVKLRFFKLSVVLFRMFSCVRVNWSSCLGICDWWNDGKKDVMMGDDCYCLFVMLVVWCVWGGFIGLLLLLLFGKYVGLDILVFGYWIGWWFDELIGILICNCLIVWGMMRWMCGVRLYWGEYY